MDLLLDLSFSMVRAELRVISCHTLQGMQLGQKIVLVAIKYFHRVNSSLYKIENIKYIKNSLLLH